MKTYGTIMFKRGTWRVDPVPYVLTKLKRIFPRVSKRAHGRAIITDTPEVARELEWFLTRYPMQWVTESDRQHLYAQAGRHREAEENFENLLSGATDPRVFNTRIPLRRYQQIGADACLQTRGLLVADELGLGKSALAIGVLCDPRTRPALVVALAHLPRQWEAEIRKFNPSLRTHILKTSKPYDLRIPVHKRVNGQQIPLINEGHPDVLISTYHKLAGWADVLAGKVKSVIFDEVQELRRGEKSNKGAAAYHIADAADFRVGLSATPIYNYGGEFHNVMRALRPGSLGSWTEFCDEWCGNRNGQSAIKDPKGFGAYLRDQHLMIRRTRSEVGRELPALSNVAHYVDCDADTIAAIETSATELARVILATHGDTARGEKMRASEELSNLVRQATGLAKAPYVAEFVKLLLEQGERVVLYGWHREVYEIWLSRLAAYKPAMYTGSESAAGKDRSKESFLKGETNLLIMSLRSGAGLDGLQGRCRTVVFGELDWSPGVHEQCLSADTEILTPGGFRGVDAVRAGDLVAGFDVATDEIRWVTATKKVDRALGSDERMYQCQTKKIALRVTGDHRMVVRRKTRTTNGVGRSPWEVVCASSLPGSSRRFLPTSGRQSSEGVKLTDYELRLLGWFVTDGHFNGRELYFYQEEKQPWNADLVETLSGCGLGWRLFKRTFKHPSGVVTVLNWYTVPKGNCPRWSRDEVDALAATSDMSGRRDLAKRIGRSVSALAKKAKKWARGERPAPVEQRRGRGWECLHEYLDKDLSPLLESMTREQLRNFLHGVNMGDGAKGTKNIYRITSTNRVFFERLQSLCVRRGFAANRSERSSVTKAGKRIYDLWISDTSEASIARPEKPGGFSECSHDPAERVWCVTNELGTLVTRRNGKVAVLGNCSGRVHRDGQTEPVVAYYLIAEDGSDPIVADVLGVKTMQIAGVRDPDADIVTKLDRGTDHVRRLAERYLGRSAA